MRLSKRCFPEQNNRESTEASARRPIVASPAHNHFQNIVSPPVDLQTSRPTSRSNHFHNQCSETPRPAHQRPMSRINDGLRPDELFCGAGEVEHRGVRTVVPVNADNFRQHPIRSLGNGQTSASQR